MAADIQGLDATYGMHACGVRGDGEGNNPNRCCWFKKCERGEILTTKHVYSWVAI